MKKYFLAFSTTLLCLFILISLLSCVTLSKIYEQQFKKTPMLQYYEEIYAKAIAYENSGDFKSAYLIMTKYDDNYFHPLVSSLLKTDGRGHYDCAYYRTYNGVLKSTDKSFNNNFETALYHIVASYSGSSHYERLYENYDKSAGYHSSFNKEVYNRVDKFDQEIKNSFIRINDKYYDALTNKGRDGKITIQEAFPQFYKYLQNKNLLNNIPEEQDLKTALLNIRNTLLKDLDDFEAWDACKILKRDILEQFILKKDFTYNDDFIVDSDHKYSYYYKSPIVCLVPKDIKADFENRVYEYQIEGPVNCLRFNDFSMCALDGIDSIDRTKGIEYNDLKITFEYKITSSSGDCRKYYREHTFKWYTKPMCYNRARELEVFSVPFKDYSSIGIDIAKIEIINNK